MIEKLMEYKNTTIYYRVYGKGKPVLLLHGFAEDGMIWQNMVTALEFKYSLIVPDIPGSGRSTAITERLSMDIMAEYIHSIVEKEEIQACSVIGHSMGGYIALAFAEKYPDKLVSLGLFHSSAYADSDEKKEGRRKNIDFIRKHGSARFLEQAIPPLFHETFKERQPLIIKDLIDRYANFFPGSLVDYTEVMMNRPDRTAVLREFRGPVLFIMGEHDTAIPLERGLKQCHIPEFSYIYICTQSAHMGMLEEPHFCSGAIEDFLLHDEIE